MRPVLLSLLLSGCFYVDDQRFHDEVQDWDGDGVVSDRFGGEDCVDDDPTIADCDQDDDGYLRLEVGGDDCDDLDAALNPTNPFWPDADTDGHGAQGGASVLGCGEAPPGYAASQDDCDDADAFAFPGADEDCAPADRNCDGDPSSGAVDAILLYRDVDADGFGAEIEQTPACEPGPNQAIDDGDCDDLDPTINPGEVDVPYDGVNTDCDVDGSDWDVDGDGEDILGAPTTVATDCDDTNALISTQGLEVCDGVDNDCDGHVDDEAGTLAPGAGETWYRDVDGDGYGDPGLAVAFCAGSDTTGYAQAAGDCDDARPELRPGVAETCDGVDQDCNGVVDDGVADAPIAFFDGDGDGYGDQPVQACSLDLDGDGADDLSRDDGDCNDADPLTHPGATEVCGDLIRQDCSDFDVNDCDRDGVLDLLAGGLDCDDANPAVQPGAAEVCDGADNDCNGYTDSEDPFVLGDTATEWYPDLDGDSYGDLSEESLGYACEPPPRAAADHTDCDDTRALVFPGAPETCDGRDEDCDGGTDEEPTAGMPSWWADADADGYGAGAALVSLTCDVPADGSANADDCDDANADVHPDTPFYRDDDGDGFGVLALVVYGCEAPAGYAIAPGDCADASAAVNPNALELCNNQDDDCNGLNDDVSDTQNLTWFADLDHDGYGDPGAPTTACSQPADHVANSLDCDDLLATVNPGEEELCNERDDDCDLLSDDDDPDVIRTTYLYVDFDRDGFGDGPPLLICMPAEGGYAPVAGDCDDADDQIGPDGAVWYLDADHDGAGGPTMTFGCAPNDGQDWVIAGGDCDDQDGAVITVGPTLYADADGDGHGDPATTTTECQPGPGWVASADDCDDTSLLASPDNGFELCDGADNDCDGLLDEDDPDAAVFVSTWYDDVDGDGLGDDDTALTACFPGVDQNDAVDRGGDCDDLTALITVPTPQLVDADDDGYGGALLALVCPGQAGYSPLGGDCDDSLPTVHPGVDDLCDGVDEDCDGQLDEDPDLDFAYALDAYLDGDRDGYGADSVAVCALSDGVVLAGGDCDDTSVWASPGLDFELCDGVDNDCDTLIDDDDDAPIAGGDRYYPDNDHDGYGAFVGEQWCVAPADYLTFSSDCDDGKAGVHPDAAEDCANGVDDDCDGDADLTDPDCAGFVCGWMWTDDDADGYGAGAPTFTCAVPAALGLSLTPGDCDDSSAASKPADVDISTQAALTALGGCTVGRLKGGFAGTLDLAPATGAVLTLIGDPADPAVLTGITAPALPLVSVAADDVTVVLQHVILTAATTANLVTLDPPTAGKSTVQLVESDVLGLNLGARGVQSVDGALGLYDVSFQGLGAPFMLGAAVQVDANGSLELRQVLLEQITGASAMALDPTGSDLAVDGLTAWSTPPIKVGAAALATGTVSLSDLQLWTPSGTGLLLGNAATIQVSRVLVVSPTFAGVKVETNNAATYELDHLTVVGGGIGVDVPQKGTVNVTNSILYYNGIDYNVGVSATGTLDGSMVGFADGVDTTTNAVAGPPDFVYWDALDPLDAELHLVDPLDPAVFGADGTPVGYYLD